MGNKNNSVKRPNKVVALVTYIIALIALLLGLFLPWGPDSNLSGTGAIWAFQLPAALAKAVPVDGLVNALASIIEKYPYSSALSLPITLNGVIEGGYDLGALFTVLYALVVLAGIIALIPAIASVASKKSKTNVALNAASFIEVLAFLFVSFFVLVQLSNFTLGAGEGYRWSYPLLGAFGGTFLMMVVQSIFYKKGSGVFKFVLLLLSALALMLTVYDVGKVIPQLEEPLTQLIGKTNGLFDGKLYNLSGASMIGILPVLLLFCGVDGANFTAMLDGFKGQVIVQTLLVCTLILALLAIINFLLDAMGLCKTTKRYMLVSNIIRYALELVVAAIIIILPFFMKNDAGEKIATTGLMSLVIAALALVALILNIIRLVRFSKKTKKAEKPAKVATGAVAGGAVAKGGKTEEVPAAASEDLPYVYTPPVYAAKEEKKTDGGEPEVYSPVIYNGPTDEFINTLSNEQKVEFARVFIERQNGNLGFIPDYVVSGKNDRFFNNIFIYFARLRAIVSTGLLNKMYEYCNLM